MPTRAIVIVPGFKQGAQGEVRQQLIDSLDHYAQSYSIEAEGSEENGSGLNGNRFRVTASDQPLDMTLRIYEAFWGDLIPNWGDETPWKRLGRGTSLITYWLTFGIMTLRRQGSRTTRIAMVVAALALLVWYFSVVMVVLQSFVEGFLGGQLPDWLTSVISLVGVQPQDAKSAYDTIAATTTVTFLVILAGLSPIEALANLSSFVRLYLRDEPWGVDRVGLRAKTRKRVKSLLDNLINGPDPPDEIVVVGHSMGGAIAVDALAELGPQLSRVALHTWGSALGMLSSREPLVRDEIQSLLASRHPLKAWLDVVIRSDFMGSSVPEPDPSRASVRICRLKIRRPLGGFFSFAETHNYYFRSQRAIEALLAPIDSVPEEAISESQ